jgi:hypothetical protein
MRRLARGTTEGRPTHRHPLVLTTMVTPLLLLALAACGDPGSGPGVASAQTAGATPSASATNGTSKGDPVKFADCMRKYGIEVDVPQGGGQGPVRVKAGPGDETKMTEAQRECRQYAPSGGPGEGQPLSKADQEKFLKFAKCMRDHGIPMKDPDFSGGGVGMMIGEGPNGPKLDEGKVEAAHKACSSNLPEEMREGPGGGSGPQEAGAAGSDGGGS